MRGSFNLRQCLNGGSQTSPSHCVDWGRTMAILWSQVRYGIVVLRRYFQQQSYTLPWEIHLAIESSLNNFAKLVLR